MNEAPGCDLYADEDGCWRDLLGRAEAAAEEEAQDDEAKEAHSNQDLVHGEDEPMTDSARLESGEAKKPVRRRVKGKKEPAWRVDAGPIDHRSRSQIALCLLRSYR